MANVAVRTRRSELYYHERYQALECRGCLEIIEIPKFAVIRAGGMREPVREHGENLLLWRELQEIEHAKCSSFGSVLEAQQARKFRKERDRRKLVGALACR